MAAALILMHDLMHKKFMILRHDLMQKFAMKWLFIFLYVEHYIWIKNSI